MAKFKLGWHEKVLLFIFALLLFLHHSLPFQFRGDRLEKAQRHLAGANAIDCGIGHGSTMENNTMWHDRSKADACAVAAFNAGKPYRVRYNNRINDAGDRPEIESSGSVRTPKGQVYFFYYRYANSWWKREYDYQQAVCPEPVMYRKAVGCGTCAEMASIDTANCIIHP